MSLNTGYFTRNTQRFRTVVAMWVVVGFGGALLFGSFGLMLITGTAMFADKTAFEPGLEFAPGEEVAIHDGVGPGNFMVLASPASTDLDSVECAWKSRVYTTGEQDVGRLDIGRPDGAAETMTTYGPTPRSFVPLAATEDSGWLGVSLLTCTGAGAASFAIADADGLMTDGYRYGFGAVLSVMTPVLLGLGALALHFTRKWRRQGIAPPAHGAPSPYVPAAHQPLPPGHNPYGPPT